MTLNPLTPLNASMIRSLLDQLAELCRRGFSGLSLHLTTKKLPEYDPSSIYCSNNTADLGIRDLVSPGFYWAIPQDFQLRFQVRNIAVASLKGSSTRRSLRSG